MFGLGRRVRGSLPSVSTGLWRRQCLIGCKEWRSFSSSLPSSEDSQAAESKDMSQLRQLDGTLVCSLCTWHLLSFVHTFSLCLSLFHNFFCQLMETNRRGKLWASLAVTTFSGTYASCLHSLSSLATRRTHRLLHRPSPSPQPTKPLRSLFWAGSGSLDWAA